MNKVFEHFTLVFKNELQFFDPEIEFVD